MTSMDGPKQVGVGLIGAGFAADLHVESCRRVRGVDVDVRAVSSRSPESARAFAGRHGIPHVYADHRELLQDPTIDVVCLCVPNVAHAPIGMDVLRAGKDLICEKPLTGYFGDLIDADPVVHAQKAMESALRSTDELLRCAEVNDRLLMYAENWVYAPAMTKAKALLTQARAPILDIRAEESHSGSHAAASKRRTLAGGGALLILGAHPIGAALHLKRAEAQWTGAGAPEVESVIADASPLWQSAAFRRSPRNWLVSDWVDVDTWSSAIMTFTDGSKAVVSASFNMLGGTRNLIEVYTASAAVRCNMTPNDSVLAYAPEGTVFGTEYIAEKIETKAGWSPASPDEDWMRGYPQEMQDFLECVVDRRRPLSDGRLARDVVEVVYGAHLSVARGARVILIRSQEHDVATPLWMHYAAGSPVSSARLSCSTSPVYVIAPSPAAGASKRLIKSSSISRVTGKATASSSPVRSSNRRINSPLVAGRYISAGVVDAVPAVFAAEPLRRWRSVPGHEPRAPWPMWFSQRR